MRNPARGSTTSATTDLAVVGDMDPMVMASVIITGTDTLVGDNVVLIVIDSVSFLPAKVILSVVNTLILLSLSPMNLEHTLILTPTDLVAAAREVSVVNMVAKEKAQNSLSTLAPFPRARLHSTECMRQRKL
jgi:hypothetical protein